MKTVIQVGIYCLKCQTSVMKAVSGLTGVNKVEVNVDKHTVTVFGDVDPVAVTKKLRKKTKKTAMILSVGPEKDEPKEKQEEKKGAASIPSCCQKCETIYLSFESSSGCAIL
ncbi:heavy metal-associated isoprenylated plant protein 43-like [Nymphaea colorata]|nr:heavy metal-associated isoprenylated plant protein 43-like [Nymphaea colorata]